MHVTDVVWWIYTALVALMAGFFLAFAWLVRKKGE